MTRIWPGVVSRLRLGRERSHRGHWGLIHWGLVGLGKGRPGNLSGILGKRGDNWILGLLHKDTALHEEARWSLARHCGGWTCVPFEC